MIVWLLLIGIVAYFIVRQSVSGITRASVWVLWLVMMSPALIWTTWTLVNGTSQPIPVWLALPPFVACPLLYVVLVQQGRSARPQQPLSDDLDAPVSVLSDPTSPAEALALAQALGSSKIPPRLLDRADEASLQDCFPWSVFYLSSVEHRPQAALCHGQLRAEPALAYRTVCDKIRQKFSDRFLVIFQEGQNGKPFFALVPNPQRTAIGRSLATEPPLWKQGLWSGGLLVLSLLSMTLMGAEMLRDPKLDLMRDWTFIQAGLPYAIGLLAVLGAHELGHYLAAKRHQVAVSLPMFIPIPALLGTLGAFTPLRSPMPHRRAMFDVGFWGAIGGLLVSLPLLVWGLAHSQVVMPMAGSGLLNWRSIDPSYSIALTLLSKAVLGSSLTAGKAIALSPIALAGYIGLWLGAFHLLPLGSLDGGRIMRSMLGAQGGAIAGHITRFAVVALALARSEFLSLALLVFFLPAVGQPALDDVTPLDDRRDGLGFLALGILVLAILPAPRLLWSWLG
ncbi:MAG: site-2 protease family protein [Oscillatoriales cyanobacterium]|nr:MAG: site-2 protease family protein [Oscillatoriales cyanobacterium]